MVAVVAGREIASGAPRKVRVTEDEVRLAMAEPVQAIVEAARQTLAEAPPELTHDVLETGMFLTGGGGLVRGIDLLLAQECEVPVHLTERPLETVVLGAGAMLDHLDEYRSSFQLVRRR
jgi:rod shape-determining protein MreB